MPVFTLDPSDTTAFEPNVYQGVVGGIPLRTVQRDVTAYGAVEGLGGSVATNNAAFTAARAACLTDQVIYFPEGIWNVTNLSLAYTLSNRTIRGAGMGLTTLRIHGTQGISLGVDPGFGSLFNVTAGVVAGFTKGSSVFTVSQPTTPNNGNPANFTVGRMLKINIPDDVVTPVVNVEGAPFSRRRYARVTSWNSTTRQLGFFPPLDHDIAQPSGMNVVETQYATQSRVGIEDLTVDMEPSSAPTSNTAIFASMTDQTWIHRVKCVNFKNRGIHLTPALMPDIRQCWMDGPTIVASNRSGILLDGCTHGLIEHNVSETTFPNFQINAGSVGNIIAYNYFPQFCDVNHGSHNSLNLFADNVTSYFIDDGYFGGSDRNIYFRNWSPSGVLASLKRFTRRPILMFNISGTPGVATSEPQYVRWGDPNIGNINNNGRNVSPSTGSWWLDWDISIPGPRRWIATVTAKTDKNNATIQLESGKGAEFLARLLDQGNGLGYATATGRSSAGATFSNFLKFASVVGDVATVNDNSGPTFPNVGETFTLYPSALGFQEKDVDVLGTALLVGNYHVFLGGIPAGEALPFGVTPPDSLHRVSKPSLFGSLSWPPFDPYNVGTPTIERIPAGYFYANGTWPTDIPAAPVITVQPLTQTVVEGAAVTLIANASGNPSPTWQWSKNGVAISGATSRFLTISVLSIADQGSYTATATNSQDSATTSAATLTVIEAADTTPPTPNPSTFASPPVATSTTITATAATVTDTTSPPVQYNHSIGGVYQGWQTSPTRVFSGLLPLTGYTIRVKARDAIGNETTESSGEVVTTLAAGTRLAPLGSRATNAWTAGIF